MLIVKQPAEKAATQQAEMAVQQQAAMMNQHMQKSNRNTGYFDE
jgi:hypothetical protein